MPTRKATKPISKRRQNYSDLTLDEVRNRFKLKVVRPIMFERVKPVEPNAALRSAIDNGFVVSMVSEKARSEFIVVPILLFIREIHHDKISIYSGVKFDVEPEKGLRGNCDFILSKLESWVEKLSRRPPFGQVECC